MQNATIQGQTHPKRARWSSNCVY